MFRSVVFRRLFLPHLALIVLAVVAVGMVGARRLRSSFLEGTRQRLHDESVLVAGLLDDLVRGPEPARTRLDEAVRRLGSAIGCRITVMLEDGQVLADNEGDVASMDNHRLRPEVLEAAVKGQGASIRASDTVHEEFLYYARLVAGSPSPYYLRLAMPLSKLDEHLRTLYADLAAAAAMAILVAALLCYYVSRRHTAPLVELTELAQALSRGDLGRRLLRPGRHDEIATLAASLNTMADSLGTLLAQAENDKARVLAMLLSMSEGVLATDMEQRVRIANAAAVRLLDLAAEQPQGRPLWEVLRHEQLLRAAQRVLGTGAAERLALGPIGGRHLVVSVSPYPPDRPTQGMVLVAHDVTESVRFQDLRKEFVANLSHELRTPLTAIKGFAETLRSGAMGDPAKGPRYLATIEKHADQLTSLAGDLLALSRLESAPGLPQPVPVDLGAVVRRAVEILLPAAQKRKQELRVEIDPRVPPLVGSPDYLERAVANLLDNAVKYTPEGGLIRVATRLEDTLAIVEVADNGIGIPAEDQPRIFERFYRVDRSRSRELGGTGLGLAIVKHIAQVHQGGVELLSKPGEGSTFRIRLPLPAPGA